MSDEKSVCGRIYVNVNNSYQRTDEHQNEEEQGMTEYLDLDMEVMEESPNYFTAVSEGQTPIYIQQNSSSQVLRVIQNPSENFVTIRPSSHQFDNHNGSTKIIWSNGILVTPTASPSEKKPVNGNNKSKIRGKRKHSSEDDDKALVKDAASNQVQSQSDGDSLDLFFQSMAQTVLQLPPQVQAAIKMEICKVISTAEIKYCSGESIKNKK